MKGRAISSHAAEMVYVALMIVLAIGVGGYLLAHQRINPPAWVPIVGQDDFTLNARLTSTAGVLPGQGQAVTVSGVRVGEINNVGLDEGNALLKMRIDRKFAHIYPNATLLMRPKTGLKDMVAELDPGTPSAGPELKDGATLDTDATDPDINFDEILSTLDADTRDYLDLLLDDAGTALGAGGGRELGAAFKRFGPLSRHAAQASRYVAMRRTRLKRVMTNLTLIVEELGGRDAQLRRFVTSSASVFRRFANQNESLGATLELLPPALRATNEGLGKIDSLSRTLETSLTNLYPGAKALAPTLRQVKPFLEATTPVLRDSLRPFAVDAQPVLRKLAPATADVAEATPDLTTFAGVLNAIFDEMAYDPPGDGPGGQSFLFYVPWANHNTNSLLSTQDGLGPLPRSLVQIGCGTLVFLESQASKRNPTLQTLIQLLNAPKLDDPGPKGICKVETEEGTGARAAVPVAAGAGGTGPVDGTAGGDGGGPLGAGPLAGYPPVTDAPGTDAPAGGDGTGTQSGPAPGTDDAAPAGAGGNDGNGTGPVASAPEGGEGR